VKPWLDPVTASKIAVLPKTSDLLQFIDVEHLPREYGGKCERCAPTLNVNIPNNGEHKDDGNSAIDPCIAVYLSDELKNMEEETRIESEKNLMDLTIRAGKRDSVTIRVHKGGVVSYAWKCTNDVGFGATFVEEFHDERSTSSDEKDDKKERDAAKIVVVESSRVKASPLQFGTYTAPHNGTFSLDFDNSFSWMKGKDIKFSLSATNFDQSSAGGIEKDAEPEIQEIDN